MHFNDLVRGCSKTLVLVASLSAICVDIRASEVLPALNTDNLSYRVTSTERFRKSAPQTVEFSYVQIGDRKILYSRTLAPGSDRKNDKTIFRVVRGIPADACLVDPFSVAVLASGDRCTSPIAPGDNWEREGAHGGQAIRATFVGEEDVETAFGRQGALKIVSEDPNITEEQRVKGVTVVRSTSWFSREVHAVVRSETQEVTASGRVLRSLEAELQAIGKD